MSEKLRRGRSYGRFPWLIFVPLLLFTPGVGVQQLPAAERLTVAHSALNLLTMPLWLAKERGFFLRRGLEAETIYIPSGTMAVQALLSGDIRVAMVAGSPVAHANLQGAPVKIIAGNTNFYPLAFFSAPEIR